MFYRPIDADLRLALAVPAMADDLFAITDVNRMRLREWLPWLDATRSADDTRAFIARSLGEFAEGKAIHFAIHEHCRICGMMGFHRIEADPRTGTVGYWISASHEGRGIITRAVRELMRYGYEDLELERVVIRAAPGNVRSMAVPPRLGFRQGRTIAEAENLYGRTVDNVEWIHERVNARKGS